MHQNFPLHDICRNFVGGGVLGIEEIERKKIVKLVAEQLNRNICVGMGYLSLHISVVADTELLFLSLLMHSHSLESTG